MTGEFALVPHHRTVRRLDIATGAIVVGFVALGLAVGMQLWNLAQLHRGLLDVATALDSTARAVDLVAGAPLIGGDAQRLADDVGAAAAQVRTSAVLARDATRAVAVGVGLAIALSAVLPVAVFYLPLRVARRRELRALTRLLARPVDPALVEHLARTAVRRVPFGELRRVSGDPWRDLERGHHVDLAAAELRRLGVPVPAWSERASDPATDPATDPALPRAGPGGRVDGG